MIIALDKDDTTFVTVNSMLKYADIYNSSVLGKSSGNDNFEVIKNINI